MTSRRQMYFVIKLYSGRLGEGENLKGETFVSRRYRAILVGGMNRCDECRELRRYDSAATFSAVGTAPSRRKNSHTSAKPSKATTDSVPAKTDKASPIAVVVAPNT
jgi:hypothetical protein